MSFTEVESLIKSCVVSKKEEVTLQDLRDEYIQLVGQDIPFHSFGCNSLEDLLLKINGVSIIKNINGESVVMASSKKADHIASLVRRQKATTKRRKKVVYCPWKNKSTPRQSFSKTFAKLNCNIISKSKRIPKLFLKDLVKDAHLTRSPLFSKTKVRYNHFGGERVNSLSPVNLTNNWGNGNDNDILTQDFQDECSQDVSDSSDRRSSDGHQRTTYFKGKNLMCTVFVTPSPQRRKIPFIDSSSSSECEEEDSIICSSWDNGPIMLSYHLVGDDFLLNFGYECLHASCDWEDLERLSCGMCISGQTIQDFHMQIRHEGIVQPRILLMLGSVDILQNHSLRSIIDNMIDLVEDIKKSSVESLVLLTLPFLLNGRLANKKVLFFNDFLKTLHDGIQVHVLDAHRLFNYRFKKYGTYIPNPKCYERFARDVLCYPKGVVFWSHLGRSKLHNFLLQKLNSLLINSDYIY